MSNSFQFECVHQHRRGVKFGQGIVVPPEWFNRDLSLGRGVGEEGGDDVGVMMIPPDKGEEVQQRFRLVALALRSGSADIHYRNMNQAHHIVFYSHVTRPLTQLRPIRIDEQR